MSKTILLVAFLVVAALLATATSAEDHNSDIVRKEITRHVKADSKLGGMVANASLILGQGFFNDITTVLVPVLNTAVTSMTVSAESGTHYHMNAFKFSSFHVGHVNISFSAPNVLHLSLMKVSMTVPKTSFKVFEKKGFFHLSCDGQFWGSLGNSNLHMVMSLTTVGGRLVVKPGLPSIQYGKLTIQHKFSGFLCKIGGSVIGFFLGGLDKFIGSFAKTLLPKKCDKEVVKYTTKYLKMIPFQMIGQPVASRAGIIVNVNLIPNTSMEEQAEDWILTGIINAWKNAFGETTTSSSSNKDDVTEPRLGFSITRDVGINIGTLALDNLLVYSYTKGLFNETTHFNSTKYNTNIFMLLLPQAYNMCKGCPLAMDLNARLPPLVEFGGARNGVLSLNLTNYVVSLVAVKSAQKHIPLFTLGFNSTVNLYNFTTIGAHASTIKFLLDIPTFSFAVLKSNIGHITVATMSKIVSFGIRDIVVPIFNAQFKGLTIPKIEGITIDDVVLRVTPGSFLVEADIKLPPIA